MANRKKMSVLSIDGGGVRGVIPAQILLHLESCLQELDGPNARIADYFDTVAGTSTGGIIAAMIATPDKAGRPRFTAKEISEFYFAHASKIFPQKFSLWSSVKNPLGLLGPKYSEKPLEKLLVEYIGDLKMMDTVVPLVIPTFDTKLQQPVFFTTSEAKSDGLKNALVRDVVRGTSAAPTYLPPKYFQVTSGTQVSDYNLVDGGLAANNPTIVAIIQTSKDNPVDDRAKLLQKFEELVVISLGCGNQTVSYTAKEVAGWGPLAWVTNGSPIINMLFNASSDIVDHTIASLFQLGLAEKHFLRIQTSELDGSNAEVDNSNSQNLQGLAEIGKKLLDQPVQKMNFSTGKFEPIPGNVEKNGDAIKRLAGWLSEARKEKLV